MEVNLPPYYDGQKVVFIGTPSSGKTRLTKGQIYSVATCEYKLGNQNHPVGKVTKYWYVGIVGLDNGGCYLAPYIFTPLEQKEFPAISFSEIVEAETKEILIAN